jgi:hypothetical protein
VPFFVRAVSLGIAFSTLCSPQFSAKTNTPNADPNYVFALAAANRFLRAWQTQDHETGLVMLTDAAKHHTSEDRLQTFFSSESAAQPAFEINRGKKLKAGRYSFPVVLFDVASAPRKLQYPRHSHIVVVKTGKDDWAIDKLP